MENFAKIISDSYTGYWNYISGEILHLSWHNYFYWILGLSLLVWLLEIIFPWRKNQPVFRKDYFTDLFYLFFNMFLFSLIGFNAISNLANQAFNDFLGLFGIENIIALNLALWPAWAKLITLFILGDFINWNTHRLLHSSRWLWKFHKVHHSVTEMGYGAHLRYHFMETFVYKLIQFIPLSMIGFGIQDFIIVHLGTLLIGHLNHANLNLSYGPLKYIFNNPVMHIWHHAKEIPGRAKGANFGISLSVWDYLFKTNYIPHSGRDIELGFKEIETYPEGFGGQVIHPFTEKIENN